MNEKLSSETFFIIECFAGLVSADILNDSLFIDAPNLQSHWQTLYPVKNLFIFFFFLVVCF
jgi:MarR-like DNA-binding transcriptional regulator SgrR of sgrS sRNA